jgi:hypothetical protein
MLIFKGQYQIINEFFLFLIGVFVVVFVTTSLNEIQQHLTEMSINSKFEQISNYISSAVVKSIEYEANTTVRIKIPVKINDISYGILINNNNLTVYDLDNIKRSISSGIFNISSKKNIICDEASSAKYILIKNTDNNITIIREW